jgi:hypothetical protein
MKNLTSIAMAVTLLSVAVTGCKSPSMFSQPGTVEMVRPSSTNQVVQSQSVTNADNTVTVIRQTNYVVSPPVYFTNAAPSALVQNSLSGARVLAEASGVPWADLAIGGISSGLAIFFGWRNRLARRKLGEEESWSATLRDVSEELRDNISTVLANLPPDKQKELKAKIEQSQIAAGTDVSSFIRTLVKSS